MKHGMNGIIMTSLISRSLPSAANQWRHNDKSVLSRDQYWFPIGCEAFENPSVHMWLVRVCVFQLFALREQQAKSRHSSGEDGKLSKTPSSESNANETDGKDNNYPKVCKKNTNNCFYIYIQKMNFKEI